MHLRRLVHRPALLGALLSLAACATPSAPPAGPTPGQPYRVGPPDQLSITVLPEPEIRREVVVRPDGMISVDLIGDVPAAGRTPAEIAEDIETRIGRYKRDARVTVSLGASRSSQVTVLGEVGRQATFPLERETRLIEAIGSVGGANRFAAKSRVRIVRQNGGEPVVMSANLNAIEQGDLRTNVVLRGGDVIVVPATGWATVGYALQAIFFPIQQVFGLGAGATTTVISGGVM
jgi:polysaccharide export outer membrane protein